MVCLRRRGRWIYTEDEKLHRVIETKFETTLMTFWANNDRYTYYYFQDTVANFANIYT